MEYQELIKSDEDLLSCILFPNIASQFLKQQEKRKNDVINLTVEGSDSCIEIE